MALQTTAGATLALTATKPATYDKAGFEGAGMTYTPVGEITDLGSWGREYNLVSHNAIGDRRTKKLKGSYNDGQIQLQLGRDASDAGQVLLNTALNDDSDYYFKVTFQDGEVQYFAAQVMSYTTEAGNVDQVVGSSVSIEITNDLIEVPAV